MSHLWRSSVIAGYDLIKRALHFIPHWAAGENKCAKCNNRSDRHYLQNLSFFFLFSPNTSQTLAFKPKMILLWVALVYKLVTVLRGKKTQVVSSLRDWWSQILPSHMSTSYLKDRSSSQYGPFHPAGIALLAKCSQTVDQEVGTLGFAWATFPRDDDALVDPLPEHSIIGHICDSENVWLQFAQLVVFVHLDVLRIVDRQELEGVDSNEDTACISVDLFLVKACAQVV